MPALIWKPTLADGTATLALALSMRPFAAPIATDGGSRKVVSGARESFVRRADNYLDLTLRVTEAEVVALRAFILRRLANAGEAWTLTLTAGGTAHDVYLEKPAVGEEWNPERGERFGTWEARLRVVKVDGSPWTESYF